MVIFQDAFGLLPVISLVLNHPLSNDKSGDSEKQNKSQSRR